MSTATIEVPTHMANGMPRRTVAFERNLDEARSAGCQVVLTGTAVNDHFVDPEGRLLWLQDLLRSYCARRELGLVSYRMGTGVVSLPTLPEGASLPIRASAPDDHPTRAMTRALEDLRQAGQPACLVFDYADLVLGQDGPVALDIGLLIEQLQALSQDVGMWQAAGLQLILVDRSGLLSARMTAQPGFRVLHLDPPDTLETSIYLDRTTTALMTKQLHLERALTPLEAGRRASGLLLRNLDELRGTSSETTPVTTRQLSELKGSAIREQSQNSLDLLDDSVSFAEDVAGLHNVRLHLRRELTDGRLTVRVALTGPAGTGKTHGGRAIARMLDVPMVGFGQILGELLGQAERNMRRALGILRALAPVVLFIDEADQGVLGARDAGGRTSNEAYGALRQMVFELLGDPAEDSGISVVATSNAPSRLDPAAQSRFTFLPVLFSSAPELNSILSIEARRANITLIGDSTAVLDRYLSGGQTLSGRSASAVLKGARVVAVEAGRAVVTPDDVGKALTKRLLSDWDAAAEFSTLSSLMRASDLDALPWVAAQLLQENYPMPAYLDPYVAPNGALNVDAIHSRLATLERNAYR